MRRGDNQSGTSAPRPSGFLAVDKPEGPSSMAAVAAVRRRLRSHGKVRVGHGGTLDPLATGVLVVGVGAATRLLERVVGAAKRYETGVDLTAFTTTDDREGERREIRAERPSIERIRAALDAMQGEVIQVPPAFSAVKIGGRRAYRLARQGAPPEMPPRVVRIDRIEIARYEWPIVELAIDCGKGTYIRSIARDLGVALGTGGHCAWLRRTAVGPFDQRTSTPLDALPEVLGPEHLLPLSILEES